MSSRRDFLGRLGRAIVAAPVMVFTPQVDTSVSVQDNDFVPHATDSILDTTRALAMMSRSSLPLISCETAMEMLGVDDD